MKLVFISVVKMVTKHTLKIIARKTLIIALPFLEICKWRLKVPPTTMLLSLGENAWVLLECTELILIEKTPDNCTIHSGGKVGIHFTVETVP